MFKRALFIFLLGAVVLSLWPAAAQERVIRAVDYVPADFAGLVQVRLDNAAESLRGLNIAAFVASRVQPNRITLGTTALAYENFIPFNTLFDVDNTSFNANVLPWLDGELVIAYRDFDAQLQTGTADVLLILPTSNVLESAARLSDIIRQQDLLTRRTYRGIDVYEGDKTSIALTSPAVFIGATDLIHAALDVQAGVVEAISANPVYGTLRAASDENPLLFAYVRGDHILPALSGLVGGDRESEALYTAFGAALANIRPEASFATRLLHDGFDGAAASVDTEIGTSEALFTAKAVFHRVDMADDPAAPAFETLLLDMIPRNALMAYSGADLRGSFFDILAALPMSNFARQMFGGQPIQTLGTDSELVVAPDAAQIQAVVAGYLAALDEFGGLDVQADLIDHLSGSYAAALLPRPNNPVPIINTPFDLLLVARAGDAALDGALVLLQHVFALDQLDDEAINDWNFVRLGADDTPVFSLGVKDGLLLLATGDAHARALDALRGDNRLTEQQPWQTLSENGRPDVYVDVSVFYNTFFPTTGGAVPPADNRIRLALHRADRGNGIQEITLSALIPTGN